MFTYDFWLGAIWTVICICLGVVLTCMGLYIWERLHPEPPEDDPWDEFFENDPTPPLWSNSDL